MTAVEISVEDQENEKKYNNQDTIESDKAITTKLRYENARGLFK